MHPTACPPHALFSAGRGNRGEKFPWALGSICLPTVGELTGDTPHPRLKLAFLDPASSRPAACSDPGDLMVTGCREGTVAQLRPIHPAPTPPNTHAHSHLQPTEQLPLLGAAIKRRCIHRLFSPADPASQALLLGTLPPPLCRVGSKGLSRLWAKAGKVGLPHLMASQVILGEGAPPSGTL